MNRETNPCLSSYKRPFDATRVPQSIQRLAVKVETHRFIWRQLAALRLTQPTEALQDGEEQKQRDRSRLLPFYISNADL